MQPIGLSVLFLRDLMEFIHRREPAAAQRLETRLPSRLRQHLDPARMQPRAAGEVLPLDEAEELLLAIDEAVGDGSGRVLEDAAHELALRGMLRGTLGALVGGDLADTLTRMRIALERFFSGVTLVFELERTDMGFELTIGIAARPRAARVLRHLATGIIRASHQFVREGDADALRIIGAVEGDRARLSVRYRTASKSPPQEVAKAGNWPVASRRPPREPRAGVGALTAEVNRILVSARPSRPPAPPARRTGPESLPSEPRATEGPRPDGAGRLTGRAQSGLVNAVRIRSDSPSPSQPPVVIPDPAPAAAVEDAPVADGRPSRPSSIPPRR